MFRRYLFLANIALGFGLALGTPGLAHAQRGHMGGFNANHGNGSMMGMHQTPMFTMPSQSMMGMHQTPMSTMPSQSMMGMHQNLMPGMQQNHMSGMQQNHMSGMQQNHMPGMQQNHMSAMQQNHMSGMQQNQTPGMQQNVLDFRFNFQKNPTTGATTGLGNTMPMQPGSNMLHFSFAPNTTPSVASPLMPTFKEGI